MRGFDPEFKTLPEYTLGITRAIWEDRGIGPALSRYYSDDVIVRSSASLQVGNKDVAATTLATLHQFPDRKLVGEDVIWAGDPEAGFLSSHRLISVMRHTGDGTLGKATGKVVRSRIIADCYIRENQVHEEWLVRDQAAFANCLGMSSRSLAAVQIEREKRDGNEPQYFHPSVDRPSDYDPPIERGDPSVDTICSAYEEIWQSKDLSAVNRFYAEGCSFFAPGGSVRSGHADIDEFLLGYLASFPDARIVFRSAFVNRQANAFDRVAMRFEIEATHSGWGFFGEPTGASVFIMGLSHAFVHDGRILMEWLAIDEVPIWKQVMHHAGSAAS
ncbi:MAG: ester cyclase [Parvularcula sp.]|nr:ester cyclase [Parvularcula sp.]